MTVTIDKSYHRKWRLEHKKNVEDSSRKYRLAHGVEISERQRTIYSAMRYYGEIEKLYGLTGDKYEAMLRKQNGLCALCHQPETRRQYGRLTRLSVDHDHLSGHVRGLLCRACNAGIHTLEKVGSDVVLAYLDHPVEELP